MPFELIQSTEDLELNLKSLGSLINLANKKETDSVINREIKRMSLVPSDEAEMLFALNDEDLGQRLRRRLGNPDANPGGRGLPTDDDNDEIDNHGKPVLVGNVLLDSTQQHQTANSFLAIAARSGAIAVES